MAVDQITKAWALTALSDGAIRVGGDVFAFRLTLNTGASFSIFQNGGPILGLVAVAMVVIIVRVLATIGRPVEAIALGLLLGGALGNLVDRIFRGDGFLDGAVVDFLDVSFFATFNLADTVIFVGVVVLLVASFTSGQADEPS